VLLQTAPVDPPPPRRSTRIGVDEITYETRHTIELTRKKKIHHDNYDNNTSINTNDSSRYLNDTSVDMDGTSNTISVNDEVDAVSISKNKQQPSKRQAKNVGGWISPDFSKLIDRSWLEYHVPSHNNNNKNTFNLSSYVPQIGDIVLYVYFLGNFDHFCLCFPFPYLKIFIFR
jgi:hypothetical protein